MVRVTHPDAPLLVFADRPQCHNSTELVIELFDRKAHLVWFPSNTSQVIQPLDGEPYANLKLRLRHERDDELLKRALCGNSLAQVVAEISPRVEREAFTEDIVKAGFKTRGVWPFDPDLIIERSKKEFVREPDTVSDLTNEAQQALTLLITEKQSTKAKGTTTRVKGIPAKNTLYTPTQLIQYDKERLERERKEAEEKEAQKKAKEEAKQKKKEEKEAKKREKAAARVAALQAKEAKKKAAEELRAAKARDKEARKTGDQSAKRARTAFVANDESFDDDFEDENDENVFPVNKPSNIVSAVRQRKKINYSVFSRSGNME